MPDYLLEVGTEELPAGYVTGAQSEMKRLFAEMLASAQLPYNDICCLSTPRRLAILVTGLAERQNTTQKKVKGPPVKSSFDAQALPLPAAAGFAAKHGMKVEELAREEIGGVEYLVANLTIEGRTTGEVLSELAPNVVQKLSGERLMRWGSSDLKFSRPIRWIVSLLDKNIVPFKLDGLESGRNSAGHRVFSPGTVAIDHPGNYQETLRAHHVMVDPNERQQRIVAEVTKLAEKVQGQAKQLGGDLLQEVVNLTEWPHAVCGQFEDTFLDLPDTLIETIMVHHQRYFPVQRAKESQGQQNKSRKNTLLPFFITISNNDHENAQSTIKLGNERVLRARLADGRFFYFDDQKSKLSDRKSALEQLTFQEGLGSYADKVNRLTELATLLARQLALEPKVAVCLERTAELCKLDLVTNLVRELPELQGYVGSWYAEQEGEPPDVVQSISAHYSPRSTDDAIPQGEVGQLASVIDKIDNLVGLFALGKKPTGSSDPYALRRQAQGVVDVLMDGLTHYSVNLSQLIDHLLDRIEPMLKGSKRGFDRKRVRDELNDFLTQRLKGKLLDKGMVREIVDSVLAARDPLTNIPDVYVRCQVIDALTKTPQGLSVVRAGVRVGNILKPTSPDRVDPVRFVHTVEREVWQTFQEKVVKEWSTFMNNREKQQCSPDQEGFVIPQTKQEYEKVLSLLQALVVPIDEFFDGVMVNDPDLDIQANRHGLLRHLDRYFRSISDFTKLQSLLI